MATTASARNGLSMGANYGARAAYDVHGHNPISNENQPLGRNSVASNNAHTTNSRRSSTQNKDMAHSAAIYSSKPVNGHAVSNSDEDIPENMYKPDNDDPDGWIHRDKLAKIESEELQAAGINLASARSRSRSRVKNEPTNRNEELSTEREGKRQRLQPPIETDDEVDHSSWDLRLPEEIEAESAAVTAAAHMYSNPLLRKSGSKIPILTSSPHPIPAKRYERDTPIARKRTASGTMSFEGDVNQPRIRTTPPGRTIEDEDNTPPVVSSRHGSPQKSRATSAALSPTPTSKQVLVSRKVSAPTRATASPSQRPGTRSGEQDRSRNPVNRPEGDPPWLATMYKPDPMLPPDQQLIPTLAKKQMQAQWAEEGAVPKMYDRDFTPIAVHSDTEMAKSESRYHMQRTPSPTREYQPEPLAEQVPPQHENNVFPLKPMLSTQNSTRPGTSGSHRGSYSTMPKVASPAIKEHSPKIESDSIPKLTPAPVPVDGGGPTDAPTITRIQAQNLESQEDAKVKKTCGCCIVM
ncbi:hypothetical protein LTR05_002989 [Lithohypha guttulata]|uniref:Uncharacterized protein n=1 Tax=Lithohypha guttulata TaxID=1690604 RepID=A0AAN7T6Y3_9EURO|nr:hypothetical protein LTR05_002989 [Lithohypha guttulata]